MNLKICSKCNKAKESSEYSWKNAAKGKQHSFCKECHSAYRHSHYLNNKDKYLKKAKRWNGRQTQILRKFIFEYLSAHPCVDCGNSDLRVLDFDHQGEKFMSICNMVRACYSQAMIEKEIQKCKVRCANCHRIKTFKKGNFWKDKHGRVV